MAWQLRRFACPGCGAERETLDDVLHVICRFCGGWIGADTGAFQGGPAYGAVLKRTHDVFTAGSLTARMMHTQGQLEPAVRAGDRASYRAICEEYHSLLLGAYPELVPGADVPEQRRDWLRSATAMAEITAFDDHVASLDRARQAATAALSRSADPVVAARALLEATVAYLGAITAHRDYSGPPLNVAHQAREMVRMSLSSLAVVFGGERMQKLHSEVLGDRAVDGVVRCPGCGAELDLRQGAQKCPFCQAVVRADEEDPAQVQMRGILQAQPKEP